MTAQAYLESKLAELRQPQRAAPPAGEQLEAAIFQALMSKKFRKYAANAELTEHIKRAIHLNVEKQQPINITFLQGGYKLWRLAESPEADWAELFALLYYSNWVKPICEMYEPGVWFDFFVDDLIIPKLNNVPLADVQAYIKSYQALLDFLRPYQPTNLRMTITPVGSQFASHEAFDKSLQRNLARLTRETPGGLPVLTDQQRTMVELNVKLTDEQRQDPKWAERIFQLHNAYLLTKTEPGYHKGQPEKILAFTQPLPSGTTLSVGTTKDSIMKFWIGAGVLKPKADSFRQIILSPAQLAQDEFHLENINVAGLSGKNFTQLRVLESAGHD